MKNSEAWARSLKEEEELIVLWQKGWREKEGEKRKQVWKIFIKKIILNDQNSSPQTLGLLLGLVLRADKAPAAKHVASWKHTISSVGSIKQQEASEWHQIMHPTALFFTGILFLCV